MHIEPGVVDGAKFALSYATGAASVGLIAKLAWDTVKDAGFLWLAGRSLLTTILVFSFFEILPHYPVGVSEVHFILGTTLFLVFGAGPAAIGLALGLLVQGALFAPTDLPQYGINLTTLIVPLVAMAHLADRIIPAHTAYKDIKYAQALVLSICYQGGIIGWVAFWAFYGQGFGEQNVAAVSSFGAAYLIVIVFEPLIDLAILAAARAAHQLHNTSVFYRRLYQPAS